MSADDQYFLDLLSSLPLEVVKLGNEIAECSRDVIETVERDIDLAATAIRQSLQSAGWIREYIAPPNVRRKPPPVPQSYLAKVQEWLLKNRAITAAVVAFIGTGSFIIWRQRRHYRQRRRAKRAANGARTEVVVLAGSPLSPLTRTLSLDLERRGFVVYIPVSTLSEEQAIRSEMRADIHPLQLDITSPSSTLEKFSDHLNIVSSFHNNRLHLSSLIILPSFPSTLPVGSLASIHPSTWSDVLNTHLLYPFTLAHAFLPLLVSQAQTHAPLPPSRWASWLPASLLTSHPYSHEPTSLLLLSPSITSSLTPPEHAPESIASAALTAWLSTLRAEVSSSCVPTPLHIINIRIGAFDFASTISRTQLSVYRSIYHEDALTANKSLSAKGSALRELHNGVFDAVTGKSRRSTVYLGRGSWAYDVVGRWVPGGMVGWMMGRMVRRDGLGDSGEGAEWERVERED